MKISPLHRGDALAEDRAVQEERRRRIEKMKIKLEDMGAGGAEEILKEYEEITERDVFPGARVLDLEKEPHLCESLLLNSLSSSTLISRRVLPRSTSNFTSFSRLCSAAEPRHLCRW